MYEYLLQAKMTVFNMIQFVTASLNILFMSCMQSLHKLVVRVYIYTSVTKTKYFRLCLSNKVSIKIPDLPENYLRTTLTNEFAFLELLSLQM